MLARLRKTTKENDEGFTLIELLVVMIIIGILAAIAIPSFLAQKDKGYQAAIKSDLKTVSIAEESYATDHDGAYKTEASIKSDTLASASDLVTNGAKLSDGVVISATASTAGDTYCLVGASKKTDKKFYLLSTDNKVVPASGTLPTGCTDVTP